jgi:hypothetical protein
MPKFKPNFNFLFLFSVLAVSLVTTQASAATHRHHNYNTYQEWSPFTENAPKFSGFFGSLGLGYNMNSGTINYTDVFTPVGNFASNVNASQSVNQNNISGLIKLGYAYRIGEKGYLGVAGFYNLTAPINLMDVTYQYGAGGNPGTIENIVTQSSGYGLLLEPGYLLTPYSLLYANVGLGWTNYAFDTTVQNAADSDPISTNKSASSYILGLGYQHQITSSPKARNLTWFAEVNYVMGSQLSISQSNNGSALTPLLPQRTETYTFTPKAIQLVLGLNYYI